METLKTILNIYQKDKILATMLNPSAKVVPLNLSFFDLKSQFCCVFSQFSRQLFHYQLMADFLQADLNK